MAQPNGSTIAALVMKPFTIQWFSHLPRRNLTLHYLPIVSNCTMVDFYSSILEVVNRSRMGPHMQQLKPTLQTGSHKEAMAQIPSNTHPEEHAKLFSVHSPTYWRVDLDGRFKTRIGNDLQILKSQSKNDASKVSIKFPHVGIFEILPTNFHADETFGAQICIAIVTPFCDIYIPTTNNRFRLRQSNTLHAEFETRSKWSPHNAANNSAKIKPSIFPNGFCMFL